MAKAVAKKEEQTTDVALAPQRAWGSENLSNKDILVPKLLLMQGLSDLVMKGEASAGQICDSVTGEVMGGVKGKEVTPVDFIAFNSFNTWVIFEETAAGEMEYVKTVSIDATNENWAYEEEVNGVQVRRDRCLNFYVLLPKEIVEGAAFPKIISFRRTSGKAGRKLVTFAAKLRAFNRAMATKVFTLTPAFQENDKGKFYVFDIGMGRDTSVKEQNAAFEWYEALKTATVKVDDSDLKGERPQAQAGTTTEY